MSLVPILLVAVVMAVNTRGSSPGGGAVGFTPLGAEWGLSDATIAAIACGPVALALIVATFGMKWCDRRLARGHIAGPLTAANRIARVTRGFIVLNHLAAVLIFDWLGAVRSIVGDPILLDEIIAILPPLVGFAGVWWAYEPIDRRLHDAMLIRQLDEGQTIYPGLSRMGYVMLQARLHLLLLLVPVLAIAGLSEIINRAGQARILPDSMGWVLGAGKLAAGAGVFMLAPLLARAILDVKPMPAGPLREVLLDVCRRHRVRTRELLIWNTNGSMINAAVMGLIGRLRYILITDALLDSLHENRIRAVMAHEVGHVRRHHLPWLLASLMACFLVAALMLELPLRGIEHAGLIHTQAMADGVTITLSVAELALGLLLFGWVCRRFERQADTFAVQHLSSFSAMVQSQGADPEFQAHTEVRNQNSELVTAEAVVIMCDALDAVARLNTIELDRPSWRHGSISWRMTYLQSIIGLPIKRLPIDRLIRRIKWASAIILIAGFGLALYDQWQTTGVML